MDSLYTIRGLDTIAAMKTQPRKTPLDELIALERDARAFGFDWPDQHMIVDQALSECVEIRQAIEENEPQVRIQEEVGDLIHTALSFCIFSGYDIDETICKVNEKFGARMRALKEITRNNGLNDLQGKSIKYMIKLWQEAKVAALSPSVTYPSRVIKPLDSTNQDDLADAAHKAFSKPRSTFETYFQEQETGDRLIWLAYEENAVAGYITLKWQSSYPFFKTAQIPEIMDLNVMPAFRKRGIGNDLLLTAEKAAATRSDVVGIGVGLYPDYGQAQRLYIKRGYIPDGQGITYQYETLAPDNTARLNDDLILWFTKVLK